MPNLMVLASTSAGRAAEAQARETVRHLANFFIENIFITSMYFRVFYIHETGI
ncbi:hypothetical protein GCM10022394_21720 [Zobellella aerophila]|uniref:Uncharacterized protein n=1 Tax=Zobellella aerophila TaxID=870480 RepID=A0ABP6VUK8_9GAMM